MRIFPFNSIASADLIIDAVYEGGGPAQSLGDPISKLLSGVGNLGGFRAAGRGNRKKYVVLYQPQVGGHRANSVGVKEVSRLISRLRHRQFGVLVTTSVVARQAYQEVREDKHPVVFICGRDITEILIENGFNTPKIVQQMLEREFPLR